jgi:small subunit ribosomal protein S2
VPALQQYILQKKGRNLRYCNRYDAIISTISTEKLMKVKTPKIEELFESGVHIGHQAKRWHPKMEKYIFAAENKIHVFDLEQTHDLLKKASEVLYEVAARGGQMIFVGTKRQASKVIKEQAKRVGALHVSERWLGGTITNFKTIKKNMEKLVNLIKQRESGELQKYTKKERLLIDREIDKLDKYVGGLVGLKGAPDIIVVIDPRKEKTVVREAMHWKIPVIALIDTNTDPSNITHPIPGNDDAIKSISLIVSTLADAVADGFKEFAKKMEKNQAEIKEPTPETPKEDKPLLINTDTKDEIATEKDLPKADLPENIEVVLTNQKVVDQAGETVKGPKKKKN